MKRNAIVGLLIPLAALMVTCIAYASDIRGTKHDLSYNTGPGPYKASSSDPTMGGTSEVCVFCHTPHGGNTDAPLWNRTSNASGYTVYSSDILSALGITAENPGTGAVHVKTRICLSCHDGTIALGSLANLPSGVFKSGYTEMQMSGQNKIEQTSPGYIGMDLRDDHPVAVQHDKGKDPELVLNPTGKIRLYQQSGSFIIATKNAGDYVECTSCHDAHDNANKKFLIEPNMGSAICKDCHLKAGYINTSSSAHNSSSAPYNPAGGTGLFGTTVGSVQCMDCHFPHKAGGSGTPLSLTPQPDYGKYLLAYQKDATCFNNTNRWNDAGATPCHGTLGSKNIETQMSKGYSHKYDASGYGFRHGAVEGRDAAAPGQAKYNWVNDGGTSLNWHVECSDCHNSHTASNTVHISPTLAPALTSNSPLYGTAGVNVTTWPDWATPQSTTGYVYLEGAGVLNNSVTGATYEYQICFKCHSDFAWGSSPPSISNLNGITKITNQAVEFNPNNVSTNNKSSHPVTVANPNNNGTYVGPWTSGSQMMYCSDCHTTSDGAAAPQGPHGSGNAAILYKTYTNSNQYGAFNGGSVGQQNSNDLCFDCHDANQYLLAIPTSGITGGTGFTAPGNLNLHTQHQWREAAAGNTSIAITNLRSYKCVNCHTRVPHGSKHKALIVFYGDGEAYEAPGLNTGLIGSGSSLNTPGNYVKGNCLSTTPSTVGCHN